ncbi:MAG: right-handed parallel beta-helix repeat-containing protein [Candidatus Acidiferrales bacterium]
MATGAATLLISAFLLAASAGAADLSVNCDLGESLQAAIDSLDFAGPNSITLTGACTENVQIEGRRNLIIAAPDGQTATLQAADSTLAALRLIAAQNILLRRLVIRGGRWGILAGRASETLLSECTLENNGEGLFAIDNSLAGLVEGTAVRNNGTGLAAATNASFIIREGVVIENNAGVAVQLFSAAAAIVNGNTIRNNGAGVNALHRSSVEFSGQNTVQNNGAFGLQVAQGSVATFNTTPSFMGPVGFTTIEGHTVVGVNVVNGGTLTFAGPHKVRNNGTATQALRSGIRVGRNSFLTTGGGTEITSNVGPGVRADLDAVLTFVATTITGNSEEGVRLVRLSSADFISGNAISGNGGASIFCDTTSLVVGDLTGIENVQCMRVERESGPPRPGTLNPPGGPNP